MFQYAIWARINDWETVDTVVWARNDFQAKQIAESTYGRGNVLSYSRIYD